MALGHGHSDLPYRCAAHVLDVIQQRVYETTHDVDILRKPLMQTWFDFDL